jgi:hypothetical protein
VKARRKGESCPLGHSGWHLPVLASACQRAAAPQPASTREPGVTSESAVCTAALCVALSGRLSWTSGRVMNLAQVTWPTSRGLSPLALCGMSEPESRFPPTQSRLLTRDSGSP